MDLRFIRVTIGGITPLLMHNDRLANPLNEWAIALKELTGKRTKTEADHREISRVEWHGGLYCDKQIGPYIPGRNVRKCIEEGGKQFKKGTAVKTAVTVTEDMIALVYDGPRDPAKLFAHAGGMHVDVRTTGNKASQSRVVRTRPLFPQWALSFTLEYFPEQINSRDLRQCVEIAGRLCGLGDYRPRPSGGTFGKFAVSAWEE